MPIPPFGEEPEAWIRLGLIAGLGSVGIRRLLVQFGSPTQVLGQNIAQLAPFVGEATACAIVAGPDPGKLDESLEWLADDGNHLLTLADQDYPVRLLEIADPPPVLYLKGRRELLCRECLAVVGSRNATPGGVQNAEVFSRTLSNAGLTIVSGLALGIDAAAHIGGLEGRGSSIAVVGTGLDRVYPSRNRALARELAELGLIISEFPLSTPALAKNFPRRNRLISGLSRGVLVVEAALASGSLITARQAADQGRDVFAIPGSIHSPVSKGCHALIKQGAKLVDDASDILIELGMGDKSDGSRTPAIASTSASANAFTPILTAMGFEPISIDALAIELDLPIDQVIVHLAEMEIAGIIASIPGGKFQRLS
jgi:DNA processing protein